MYICFSFVSLYCFVLNSNKMFTFYYFSCLSNLLCQTLSKASSESYDLVRTLRMAGYGMIILGPSLHYWFNFVSKTLPKRDLITTLKKIVLGQIVYGPAMNVVFFSVNAAAQGIIASTLISILESLHIMLYSEY